MIDDSTVDLFGDPIVVTPVPRFHVIHRHAQAPGYDCREPAIGVPQEKQSVWTVLEQQLLAPFENLSDLASEGFRVHTQVHIRRTHPQFLKKYFV
jgi:hypothetical protein